MDDENKRNTKFQKKKKKPYVTDIEKSLREREHPNISQDVWDELDSYPEFMSDPAYESKANEILVSWTVDGDTSQTNADWQFAQLVPILGGSMRASFRNTQPPYEFSFIADFEKESDAEEWKDNLRTMTELGVKIDSESKANENKTYTCG